MITREEHARRAKAWRIKFEQALPEAVRALAPIEFKVDDGDLQELIELCQFVEHRALHLTTSDR